MAGQIITSEELARHSGSPALIRAGYFSPAVRAGPFVYISGTAARDRSKDIRGQTVEVFDHIGRILAEVGYDLSDLVKIQGGKKDLTRLLFLPYADSPRL